MSDINYFEIIKNKLDAVVDKIMQREASDENFRITYAQILEKINTKMDLFSSTDEIQKIEILGSEVRNLICEKDENLNSKLTGLCKDFDELYDQVQNCIKTPEIVQAFQTLQKNIKYFSEEIENQRAALNNLITNIEKFGNLDNTNRFLESEFNIIKSQNAIINDTLVNQLQALNNHTKEYDTKFIELISTINQDLNDVMERAKMLPEKSDTNIIFNKIEELTLQFEESKNFILGINNNIVTLIDVVDNIFSNDDFEKTQKEISEVLVNTTLLSEAVKLLCTKEDINSSLNESSDDIKKYTSDLIEHLEEKILSKLDFSALDNVKDFAEKILFQGTEVLKEEIWSIKDSVGEVKGDIENISTKLDTLRDEIADNLSKESIAKAYQFENIAETVIKKQANQLNAAKEEITEIISEESIATQNQLNTLKDEVTDIISEESTASQSQISSLKNELSQLISKENIATQNEIKNLKEDSKESIDSLKKQFLTQLVQVAENISFVEEAEDIHEHIYTISDEIAEKINSLKNTSEVNAQDLIKLLEKINSRITGDYAEGDYIYTLPDVESDLTKIRLDLNNISKTLINTENMSDEKIGDIYSSLNNLKISIERLENSNVNEEIVEVKKRFDELNEDISSISKRTNKLIISSDEVNKTLQKHIDEFTKIVEHFDTVTKKFTDDALIHNINQRLEILVNSNKALNEAFMYLAEWIDNTSESFNSIKENFAKISEKYEEPDYTADNLKILSKKVEQQEAKLVLINEKLDTLMNGDNSEVKSLLEFIASQVSVANEKIIEHDKMAQRVESIERQLKKVEKNIGLITAYLEDDED